MSRRRYNWQFPQPVPRGIELELDSFSPAMRSLLYQRGITTNHAALEFLQPTAPAWHSDRNLLGSETAASLILEAINNKGIIAVYGDYDADGITSTAMLTLVLRSVGAEVIPYIPDRQTEGYGLNKEAISYLAERGVSLLITVDNGIRSIREVDHAAGLGMKVIITDHHAPGEIKPGADVILNPKLGDDPYPNKNLAGVGVAYKLVCKLSEYLPQIDPEAYLDLVAIGTVADIVPLVGENRYLVRRGLTSLNFKKRQAIQSLLGASGNEYHRISASDISYQIAPRINSSGRLASGSALTPLNLLLSTDPAECSRYAQIIENQNHKRKIISSQLVDQVEMTLIEESPPESILIYTSPDVKLGVAGIAAGYLCRKYNLPAIVGKTDEGYTTASCRSIPAFNMIQSLERLDDLLEFYGGHQLAAGFTISNGNLPLLESRLREQAAADLPHGPQVPMLQIDAEVGLDELNSSLIKELDKIEPAGSGNPLPVFVTRNLQSKTARLVGSNSDHLKLVVTDGKVAIDAIGFGLGELLPELTGPFDLVYHLGVNEYRGSKNLQISILDALPS